MMRLVLASDNKGKLKEMRGLLSDMDIEVLSKSETGCTFEVEETGATFEENARIKALAVCKATGFAAIADDSGLEVFALSGEPGVYSARYSGSHEHSDEHRNSFLLGKLEGESDRRARFVSCVCCRFPNGDELCARGECEGSLLFEAKGDNGFGYDPIFVPAGFDRTMGELSADEKNAISHRGKSFLELKNKLWQYLNSLPTGKEI